MHVRLSAIRHIILIEVFLAWTTYVWANAVTFGPTPECNSEIRLFGTYTATRAPKNGVIFSGTVAALVMLGTIVAVLLSQWERLKATIRRDDPMLIWAAFKARHSVHLSVLLSIIFLGHDVSSFHLCQC